MESLAYAYMHLDVSIIMGISFLCMLAGATINYATNKSAMPMVRSSYFFATGALALAMSAEGLIWLAAPSVIASNKLFLILLAEIWTATTLGYLSGLVAIRRSTDAYGTTGNWWLAFIPFANLILLLEPSENPPNNAGRFEKVRTAALVIGGFVMIAGSIAMSISIRQAVEKNTQAALRDNPVVAYKLAQAYIDHGRLEDLLKSIAKILPVPSQLNETTTLTKVSTKGKEIIFQYSLSEKTAPIPDSSATALQKTLCTTSIKRLIERGATVILNYSTLDDPLVSSITIDALQCDNL